MSADSVPDRGPMFLVTGPMASGKSTIAAALAATFERAVHLEGDVFRRFIVAGREEVTPEADDEALAQLRLRYRLMTDAAHEYARCGFTVVMEDVVAGGMLRELVGRVAFRPLLLVVLLPGEDVLERRETERASTGYAHWTVAGLYNVFAEQTERLGLWLDTSDQTPEETVGEILARADEASLG